MVNTEQLARLRASSAEYNGCVAWNQWRQENVAIRIDLSSADLNGADLSSADLIGANLSGADLSGADLSDAHLAGADLSSADLAGAHLTDADLTGAHLTDAALTGAHFTRATVGWTVFGDVDLRQISGLENVHHLGPSTLGIDTLYRSRGAIPDAFLRGCGVPDSLIEFAHALVHAKNPIDYCSVFISYNSEDEPFAKRLYADLQTNGVRCWFVPEHMSIGDKIRHRTDESIRVYDKLLVVLSEHSLHSKWVEYEVEMALRKERQQHHTILFPVRLDASIKTVRQGWADYLRTRHIGVFDEWKEHDAYQIAFQRLLHDLTAEPSIESV